MLLLASFFYIHTLLLNYILSALNSIKTALNVVY